MRITKVKAYPVRVPMRRFSNAYSDYVTGQFVLVEVEIDEGVVGYGEAFCTVTIRFYGETLETVTALIRNYKPEAHRRRPAGNRRLISILNIAQGGLS